MGSYISYGAEEPLLPRCDRKLRFERRDSGRGMRIVLLLCALAFAGCLGYPGETARSPDVSGTVELLGHLEARYHSGRYHMYAFPPDNVTPPRPVSCTAYRGGIAMAGDTCEVITPESTKWHAVIDNVPEPEWGLYGAFRGRARDTADHPDPTLPRTMVAFDAEGRAAAYWNGTMHPRAGYMTE